jgi:DNA-binding FadR family transcriptional regulator
MLSLMRKLKSIRRSECAEGYAAYLATLRATDEDLRAMEAIVKQQKFALKMVKQMRLFV